MHSTMGQERLSSLGLQHIESDIINGNVARSKCRIFAAFGKAMAIYYLYWLPCQIIHIIYFHQKLAVVFKVVPLVTNNLSGIFMLHIAA